MLAQPGVERIAAFSESWPPRHFDAGHLPHQHG